MKKINIIYILSVVLLFFFVINPYISNAEEESITTIYEGIINKWDGYQINNIIFEVDQTVVSENEIENNGKDYALLKIYEWVNDEWKIVTTIKVKYNEDKVITINDNIYQLRIIKIVDNTTSGCINISIKSNINSIYIKEIIRGGHKNTNGYGDPQIKVIKEVNSNIINIDDLLTVTVTIENDGKYDAYNIVIQDPSQPYFALVETLVNDTTIDILKPNEKRTVLIYKLQPIKEGIFEIKPSNVIYINKENKSNNIISENDIKIHVLETIVNKPKITITNDIKKQNIKAYTGTSEIKLKVLNNGNENAKNIKINIMIPDEVYIKSKSFDNKTIYIKDMEPNSELIFNYYIKSNNIGSYEINTQYSYSYINGNQYKNESGFVNSYSLNVEESIIWFLLKKVSLKIYLLFGFITIILSYISWKRYLEYKY